MRKQAIMLTAAVLAVSLSGCGVGLSASDSDLSSTGETARVIIGDDSEEAAEASASDASDSALSAVASSSSAVSSSSISTSTWAVDLDTIDMTAWQYNASDDVYWQVGVAYCAYPADESYETLGIFVPGSYFTAVANGDGTYTCTVNDSAAVNGYMASTAPILFPVNTPGHKVQSAPTGYVKAAATYTDEGFIYVVAGCRGKDVGLPSGVTDLKAAIRYIRYCEDELPGSTDRIVVFGHSGGGSQSSVLGASGDSALYLPYLEALGAAPTSDAVAAVMAWCPITGFDSADLGYEWNMGTTRSGLSDEFQAISDALAAAYADYVNEMGFTDEAGNVLTLEASEDGIYQAGSYYEYVKAVIEESLEHYLADNFGSTAKAQAYVDGLNEDGAWVTYDASTGSVTISSIADFAEHCKHATKPIAAFDKLTEGGHELFNTGDGSTVHFDTVLAELVAGTSYESEFADDFALQDSLGNSVAYRLAMFSPLTYLMPANDGYGTADVAQYWRIRTGIEQTDTVLTTEINLMLALQAYGADVDFETVWEEGHTQAERTGSGGANMIDWINSLWQ